jgi:hypothetical protein
MASLESVLILWADLPVGAEEILALLDRAWPGPLGSGVRISTYEVMPNRGMAEAMVYELERRGELSPGSVLRMRTVAVGRQRLVVLIRAAPEGRLSQPQEAVARRLARLVTGRIGWLAQRRIKTIGRRLAHDGGLREMRAVAERAGQLSTNQLALFEISHYWDQIGDWRR